MSSRCRSSRSTSIGGALWSAAGSSFTPEISDTCPSGLRAFRRSLASGTPRQTEPRRRGPGLPERYGRTPESRPGLYCVSSVPTLIAVITLWRAWPPPAGLQLSLMLPPAVAAVSVIVCANTLSAGR